MKADILLMKKATEALLQAVGKVHSSGNQDIKVSRYVIKNKSGDDIEIMLEKDAKSPLNLWIRVDSAGLLIDSCIPRRMSSPPKICADISKKGEVNRGRHTGLKTMLSLKDAELICFKPINFSEVGAIIDHLLR